jgi:hypothetical protein
MEEEKLNEMFEMVRENNSMLRTMRRNAMVGSVLKFAFWVIILVVVPYYIWQYFQPYLEEIQHTYQSVQTTSDNVSNSDIAKFFEQFAGNSSGK